MIIRKNTDSLCEQKQPVGFRNEANVWTRNCTFVLDLRTSFNVVVLNGIAWTENGLCSHYRHDENALTGMYLLMEGFGIYKHKHLILCVRLSRLNKLAYRRIKVGALVRSAGSRQLALWLLDTTTDNKYFISYSTTFNYK
jgi:hypothetical protein